MPGIYDPSEFVYSLEHWLYSKRGAAFPGAWLVPMQTPGLRAFWPCNMVAQETGAVTDFSPGCHHLTCDVGMSEVVVDHTASWPGVCGLYTEPGPEGKNWLYRADDALGAITEVLTFGAWAKLAVLDKDQPISWQAGPSTKTGAMLRYGVDAEAWQFGYGTDGETLTYVTDSGTVETGVWYFLAARFVGGIEATLIVNNRVTTTTSSIPAHIAEHPAGQRGWQLLPLDGFTDGTCPRVSQAWISALAVPDHFLAWHYAMQGPLFGSLAP